MMHGWRGGGGGDIQSTPRSAQPKVVSQVPRQRMSAVKWREKRLAGGLGLAGCEEKFFISNHSNHSRHRRAEK